MPKKVKRKRIFLVAGARPNFMKIAPLWKEMKKYPSLFEVILVHTGQHYAKNMSELFFKDLELPAPDIYLGVGSGSQAEQTAKIMIEFEKVCLQERPALVVVVGDVNSTLACSVVSAKLLIPVAHIEAGLRSFDRTMPEEINRLVTDALSAYLFTTGREADKNLIREGISKKKIYFVGNVMIDTLKMFIRKSVSLNTLRKLGLKRKEYALLTLHRPSNVDDRASLEKFFRTLKRTSQWTTVVFPVHPRTQKQIKMFKLEHYFTNTRVKLTAPLAYLDFLNLMANAKLVLTDSGGIQEETTVLGIPCLTLRQNTERPVTITQGTNTLVGSSPQRIIGEVRKIITGRSKKGRIPELWDGQSAGRIVNILRRKLKWKL